MSAIPKPDLPPPSRNPFGRSGTEQRVDQPERAPKPNRGHRGEEARNTAKPRRAKRPADTRDVLLSLPTDLATRMESVIAYTYPHTGVKTQQAFIRQAIAQACADMEDRYNDGEMWPAIPKPEAM